MTEALPAAAPQVPPKRIRDTRTTALLVAMIMTFVAGILLADNGPAAVGDVLFALVWILLAAAVVSTLLHERSKRARSPLTPQGLELEKSRTRAWAIAALVMVAISVLGIAYERANELGYAVVIVGLLTVFGMVTGAMAAAVSHYRGWHSRDAVSLALVAATYSVVLLGPSLATGSGLPGARGILLGWMVVLLPLMAHAAFVAITEWSRGMKGPSV